MQRFTRHKTRTPPQERAGDPSLDNDRFALRYSVRQRRQVRGMGGGAQHPPRFWRAPTWLVLSGCSSSCSHDDSPIPSPPISPHPTVLQVERFNPVQYEGEMGSQQPMDRRAKPAVGRAWARWSRLLLFRHDRAMHCRAVGFRLLAKLVPPHRRVLCAAAVRRPAASGSGTTASGGTQTSQRRCVLDPGADACGSD